MPIPWIRKVEGLRCPNLPNNRTQAANRFYGLKKRLQRDSNLSQKYNQGIQDLLIKGYAERVPVTDLGREDGKVFYLPHYPVVSTKKDKVRIVYDCSATYQGTSLNNQVLQGPDLTSKLTAVLLRFRQHPVAVAGDVEAMYYQVKVPLKDRDILRFLWSLDGVLDSELSEYRMTVHLFGGVWSSSAANYCLRRTADDNAMKYSP